MEKHIDITKSNSQSDVQIILQNLAQSSWIFKDEASIFQVDQSIKVDIVSKEDYI